MDDSTLTLFARAQALGERLKQPRQTIAVAESSTGGLVSAALLSVPGASAYFRGGGVIYTGQARNALLGLPEELTDMRPATEAYATLLARRMRTVLNTYWAVAETGATGPTGNRYGDKAGHTCFAVVGPVERSRTLETGSADRSANMLAFAAATLDLLGECLADANKG